MRLGELLGRLWFYRAKGMLYIEAARQWVLPLMGGTAAAKYLGMPLRYAIPAWIGLAIVAECCAVLFGWLERRSGATRANYGLSRDTDPWKTESLALQAETVRLLKALAERLEENQRWKPVVGYEGRYQVSNDGLVRNAWAGRIVRPNVKGPGYLYVNIRGISYAVHQLVVRAFIGPPPTDKHCVNHIDGNRQNNSATNLEWATPKENTANSIARGTFFPHRRRRSLESQPEN